MPYRILQLDEHGNTIGYYPSPDGRYYLIRFFAERRARLLAKSYRFRKFIVEATR